MISFLQSQKVLVGSDIPEPGRAGGRAKKKKDRSCILGAVFSFSHREGTRWRVETSSQFTGGGGKQGRGGDEVPHSPAAADPKGRHKTPSGNHLTFPFYAHKITKTPIQIGEIMAQKIRVNLMIEKKVWDELRQILKEKGYPRGVPSWLAQQAFERTILELEHASSSQIDLFFYRREK